MIIATAGHVDHGKTSLVRRLTGVDTDRLPEEKRRGLTIDLGFAYTELADGTPIGFVDVPGHERFLRNMLAGVLSLDAAILVVAVDDGPMPQTREHLAILDLTGVRHVLAVVTKVDRVPLPRVERVIGDVRLLLQQRGFENAAVIPVSSEAGTGFTKLADHLSALAGELRPPPAARFFRMAVDRCFSIVGTGTVLTGTVAAGEVRVGDLLVLTPSGTQVRVRSIRVRDRPSELARAGDRCALAIVGARLDRTKIERGEWAVSPELHAPTTRVDVHLRLDNDAELRAGLPVHAHLGTSDVIGHVTPLGTFSSSGGFARLAFDTPVAALYGDRIVLRDHAARRTLAGGRIIDAAPSPRRRRLAQRLAVISALALEKPEDALHAFLEAEGSIDLQAFARSRNLDPDRLDLARTYVIERSGAITLVAERKLHDLKEAVREALAAWHQQHPAAAGISKAALVGRLRAFAEPSVADAVIGHMAASGEIGRQGAALHLPTHAAKLAIADAALWEGMQPVLAASGLRTPRVREIAEALGLSPEDTEQALVRLESFGLLLRVARNRFFPVGTVRDFVAVAEALVAETAAGGGGFPASAFAARTAIGRNLTIQVLEFLDRIGVTRRVGELRHVVRPLDDALG